VIVDGETEPSTPVVRVDRDEPTPGWRAISRFDLLVAVAAAAIGIGQRIWILNTPRLAYLDSDEAVVGLIARQFPGQRPLFFWGQFYGGVAEPLLTAGVFRVFGASVVGLKLVPMGLCAVAALLVGAIGRHFGGTRLGVLAASVFWVWPAPFVWWSTKSRGFYWIVIVAGLVAVLMLLQFAATQRRVGARAWWWRVTLLGLAIGVGWWSSPQIALIVVPMGVWFVLADFARAWRVALGALPGFFVGSLAWWFDNFRSGFRSLESPVADADPFFERVARIIADGTPMALGVKVPYAESWIAIGPLWLAIIVMGCIAGAVALLRPGWRGPGIAVVATLVTYPVLAAVSPLSGYVGEGRYLVFASPFVALVLGAALAKVPRGIAVAAVGALAILTVAVLAAFTAVPGPAAPDVAVPDNITPLIEFLDDHDVTTVEADYWIAYRLVFESDERIVAATTTGIIRNDRYQDAVIGGADARVFVVDSAELHAFRADLERRGVDYPFETVDGFVVYLLRE